MRNDKNPENTVSPEPVVFLHGFEGNTLFYLVKALKKAASEAGLDAANIAFTSSTPINLEWKVKALIREVRKEHEYFKANPLPAKTPGK
jgi:hypothetical protein